MNGELSDDEEEYDNHMPITQAEPPSSPTIGLSQATTVSKVSSSTNAAGRNNAAADDDEEGSEENELEVSFKVVDENSDKMSSFSRSPMSSSNNLAALVSPPTHTFTPPSSRLPAKENTFGATLWQHLNSNDPHIGENWPDGDHAHYTTFTGEQP